MYDEQGNPFGVLCTNPECPYYEGRTEIIDPLWSEDCLYKDGRVICPKCLYPVTRPQDLPENKEGETSGGQILSDLSS